jgi:NADH dehydrogenase [ubiquinone] 1 alpha subcomplex assembly factor 3
MHRGSSDYLICNYFYLIIPIEMLRSQLLRLARPNSARAIHTTRPALSLTNIFDTADRPSLTIAKLTPKGFHLSDDLVVPGGLVLAGYQALLWDVDPPKGDGSAGIDAAWAGWTKERFQVFESVVPRPGTSCIHAEEDYD